MCSQILRSKLEFSLLAKLSYCFFIDFLYHPRLNMIKGSMFCLTKIQKKTIFNEKCN
jgi:hypothetical protein